MIVTIPARDVKSGDVLVLSGAPMPLAPGGVVPRTENDRHAVTYVVSNGSLSQCEFIVAQLDASSVQTSRRYFCADDGVRVERPDLTPAQQHADELVEFVRKVDRSFEGCGLGDEASKLLAVIDPPKPPTLDEALALLRDVRGMEKLTVSGQVGIDKLLARVPK